MPVWRPRSAKEQPVIELRNWSVYEINFNSGPSRHLIGRIGYENEGRVSSPIIKFNRRHMFAKTRSGRKYKLVGPSNFDSQGSYVFANWKYINNITNDKIKDVSVEYEKKSNRPGAGLLAG